MISQEDEMAFAAVALAALSEHGIRADIIELLLRGNAREGVPRGAIYKAVRAIVEQIEIHKRQQN